MIITTKIGTNGRLGNSFFQAAAVFGLSKKLNAAPVFPEWEYSKYLKNELPSGPINITHHYHEPYFHFTPIDLNESVKQINSQDKIFNLHGYYQSIKYWDNCERLIKEQFQPSQRLIQKLRCVLPESVYNCCSIHVRRGDYVDNNYYAQLDMDYYERAMFLIKELTRVDKFLVFSDDIPWCREYFVGDEFIFMEDNLDIEDLFLMSFCDHNIIANSSFSWWGSYLNNNVGKKVIAPQKWFGENTVLDTKDLYLKNWITI